MASNRLRVSIENYGSYSVCGADEAEGIREERKGRSQ